MEVDKTDARMGGVREGEERGQRWEG